MDPLRSDEFGDLFNSRLEGVRPRFTHQRRWQHGRTLQRAPLNPLGEELYGAPHMTIHRADLLAVIASGFPAERIGNRSTGQSGGRPARALLDPQPWPYPAWRRR